MREIFRFILFTGLALAGGVSNGAYPESGGIVSVPVVERALRIQLSTDGIAPYEENIPGDVLASFSDNVFGNWIRLVAPAVYGSDLIEYQFHDGAGRLSVRLRDGVHFHNGRPLNSDDFVFSLLRGLYTSNHAFYAGFLGCLDGVGKLSPGQVPRGISVRSSREVDLLFNRSCPEIVHALGLPYVAPRPREEMSADLIHFKGLPVGAGPYRVTREDVAAGEYSLSRIGDRAGPDQVILQTKSGNVSDILLSRNEVLAPGTFTRVFTQTPSMTTTLFASNRHPLLSRPEVRALFYAAIDRTELIANAGETPAYGLSLYGNSTETTAEELKRARRELAPIAASNPDLKIAIFGSPDDLRKKRLITSLTKQFAEIGFRARFEFVNKKFLTEDDAADYAYQVANLIIDPLATGVMLSSWRASSANPFHRVTAPDLEALFRDWETAPDTDKKNRAASRLDDYVTRGGFGVPLLRSRSLFIYNPQTVANLGDQVQPLAIDLPRVSLCASFLR